MLTVAEIIAPRVERFAFHAAIFAPRDGDCLHCNRSIYIRAGMWFHTFTRFRYCDAAHTHAAEPKR